MSLFPKPITELPEADIPIEGLSAYISQSENHQIVFMEFEKDTEVPEHSHESQWEIVLEGRADVCIDGIAHTFNKGDRFYISKDVKHSAKIHAGYTALAFFSQKDRYKPKQK